MKFLLNLILVVGLVSCVSLADKVSYKNYKVYRLKPTNEDQIKVLRELENGSKKEYSFWTPVRSIGLPVDILVSPEYISQLERISMLSEIDMQLMINDVQTLIDNEELRLETKAAQLDWTNYWSLDEV